MSTTFSCTAAHRLLLANGVKFVPTPPFLRPEQLQQEIDRFVNTLRWRWQFRLQDRPPPAHAPHPADPFVHPRPQMPALHRSKGATAPPTGDRTFEEWIAQFTRNVQQLGRERLCNKDARLPVLSADPHLRHLNLPRTERLALRELQQLTRYHRNAADNSWSPPKLVIANADKNLGLVLMDYEWFHKEALRQLSDHRYYTELPEASGRRQVQAAFKRLQQLVLYGRITTLADHPRDIPLEKKQSAVQKFLWSRPPWHKSHRVPSFRVIAKVHKNPVAGRPITPANNFLFAPANDLITQYLHPLVTLIPEVLRDSTQLLFELEESATLNVLPGDEIYLVTGDVESLYTNIPRRECIELLRLLPIPSVVLDLLCLVFEFCIVRFASKWFRQHDGFPMGIEPAPDVANLFMWLLVHQRLGPPPPERRLYRRLIDDLFIVWVGPRAALDRYLARFNSDLHPRIRITWTVSNRSADFLDLHIHLGERFHGEQGRLDVKMHQKLLNRYLYIPALSFHKRTQHRAWIKAELLRILRNTSSSIDYQHMRRTFFARLLARGHSVEFLRETFAKTMYAHTNRDSLLSSLQRRQDKSFLKAVHVVNKCVTPDTNAIWLAYATFRQRVLPDDVRHYDTPWPQATELLLRDDYVNRTLTRSLDEIFPIFTCDAPPLAFFLPLTSATAGLRWGQLTLTLPPNPLTRYEVGDRRNRDHHILLVLRRPSALGSLLRFHNPEHAKPEDPPPPPAAAPPQRGHYNRTLRDSNQL